MNEVSLGEYLSFCKDFKVPLSKQKVTEIFKKSSDSHKPLKFENFTNSLTKIGVEFTKYKIEETNKKLSEIEREI